MLSQPLAFSQTNDLAESLNRPHREASQDLSDIYGLGTLEDMAYSEDLSLIATVGSRGLALWQSDEGKLLKVIDTENKGQAKELVLSPQGYYAAVFRLGEWELPKMQRTASQVELYQLFSPEQGLDGDSKSLNTHFLATWPNSSLPSFDSRESYLGLAQGKMVQLIELKGLKPYKQFDEGSDVIKLFWGRQRPILVSANDNGIITLRDISQQKVMSRIRYPNSLQSLRLSEDDSMLMVLSGDAMTRVSFHFWQSGLQLELANLEGRIGEDYALSPDKQYFAARLNDHLRLWSLAGGLKELEVFNEDHSYLLEASILGGLSFSPDSEMLSFVARAGPDKLSKFCLWNLVSQEVRESPFEASYLHEVRFSATGDKILAHVYDEIPSVGRFNQAFYLWEQDLSLSQVMAGYLSSDITTMVSPHSQFLAAAEIWGGPIYLWHRGEVLTPYRLGRGPYRWLEFSPDEASLLAGSSRYIDIWDISGYEVRALERLWLNEDLQALPEGLGVFHASYSPQGSKVILYFSYPSQVFIPDQEYHPLYQLEVRDGHDFRLLSKIHLESITGARGTIQDISFTADESQFAVLIDDTYWDGQRGNIVNKSIYVLDSDSYQLVTKLGGLEDLSLVKLSSGQDADCQVSPSHSSGMIRLQSYCKTMSFQLP
ncbi:MAG: WD40 repeat domain-containing protein [Deinococcales bacterium]